MLDKPEHPLAMDAASQGTAQLRSAGLIGTCLALGLSPVRCFISLYIFNGVPLRGHDVRCVEKFNIIKGGFYPKGVRGSYAW